jgi:hypothetical protein
VDTNAWCQEESITTDNFYSAGDLINRRRALSFDVAIEIYSQFGWTDPPMKELEEAQQKRFGPSLHL